MAEPFVELTRIDADPQGTTVLVNLENVAWIERDAGGASRVVFAVVLRSERADDAPLSMVVRESTDEIRLLAGLVQKTDRDAIAQAWADQTARRGTPGQQG